MKINLNKTLNTYKLFMKRIQDNCSNLSLKPIQEPFFEDNCRNSSPKPIQEPKFEENCRNLSPKPIQYQYSC